MQLTVSDWAVLAALFSGAAMPSQPEPARLAALGLMPTSSSTPTETADRGRLYAFALKQALILDLFPVPGGVLAAANLDIPGPSGLGRQTVSGKGFSAAQAVLRCLGEAVEIASWAFRDRDRAQLFPPPAASHQLSARAILGFSTDQIADRDALNQQWSGWDVIPPAQQLDRADLWTDVRTVDGSLSAACPAFLCFGGLGRTVDGDDTLNTDSSGCAAGPSFEAAALSAMLERAERDATGIWWWRGCRRGRVDPAAFEDVELLSALAEHRAETGRRLWFLDISALPGADVMVAVSCTASGGDVALGFGCALRMRDAVRSAFLEMLQTELAMDAQEIRAASSGPPPGSDRRIVKWRQSVNLAQLPFLAGGADGSKRERGYKDPAPLSDLLQGLTAVGGQDVWFADLSRPDIGVAVVKAITPGLAHFKPRLGCARLWTLPEHPGWTTSYEIGRTAPPFLFI